MAASIISSSDRAFVEAASELITCSPFIPERRELERKALGAAFQELERPWYLARQEERDPNLNQLEQQSREVLERCRSAVQTCKRLPQQDRTLYINLVFFTAYYRFGREFNELITGNKSDRRISFYNAYQDFCDHHLQSGGGMLEPDFSREHFFAYGYQLRRAFFHIFSHIIGTSRTAGRLRARVWQSIFTHDTRRYLRSLYDRMGDIITLITGPSGTGKELVARAIAMSRYIPFDPEHQRFEMDYEQSFYPINLTALSPTLIESELFGHRKGAFTGALKDRKGYLEECGSWGTVFLDEVGDVDPIIQVKLLRLLQTREFQPLGDTETLPFHGKLMAATNRDLVADIQEGRFREDFFFRLCADQVQTPGLRDILTENQEELPFLVQHIATKVAGPDEADALTREVCDFIEQRLGPDYPWPGNFRELEQCVRNILVHCEYDPHRSAQPAFRLDLAESQPTARMLLTQYATRLYARLNDYTRTAEVMDIDPRTVKKYVDPDLLEQLNQSES